MAVAVQPASETKGTSAPAPLWLASLTGGLYVLGALAVVFYAVPKAWGAAVADPLTSAAGPFVNFTARLLAQLAAAVALAFVGARLVGPNPPRGVRGGIFWAIVTILTVFFVSRMVATWFHGWLGNEGTLTLFLVALASFGFLGLRFLRGQRFQRWAVGMEEGGWFRTTPYKRSQGLRVRRMTILGVLLLAAAGIITLINNGHLPSGEDWTIVTPFLPTITLLPDMAMTVPLLLGALSFWFAYRVVNNPTFADFLIATEAEMNKVSWTPRRRLIQDTVVVLATVFILTAFLFVVDVFWGWFLSRDIIGVLPQTEYKYVVMLERVPDPNKKDDVVKALVDASPEANRLTDAAARLLVQSAPQGDARDKNLRPQVVGSNMDEAAADRLVQRLREAGAEVAQRRSTGQQTGGQLRW